MDTSSSFRENIKLIIVRRFFNEAKANIYAAYLRGEGVNCFISNTNTGTLLPFINGGFLLHVAERDLDDTNDLLVKLDQNAATRVDEDYREADLDDIAYEKSISDHDERIEKGGGRLMAVMLIVVVLIITALFAFIRGSKANTQTIGMHRVMMHDDVSFI